MKKYLFASVVLLSLVIQVPAMAQRGGGVDADGEPYGEEFAKAKRALDQEYGEGNGNKGNRKVGSRIAAKKPPKDPCKVKGKGYYYAQGSCYQQGACMNGYVYVTKDEMCFRIEVPGQEMKFDRSKLAKNPCKLPGYFYARGACYTRGPCAEKFVYIAPDKECVSKELLEQEVKAPNQTAEPLIQPLIDATKAQ